MPNFSKCHVQAVTKIHMIKKTYHNCHTCLIIQFTTPQEVQVPCQTISSYKAVQANCQGTLNYKVLPLLRNILTEQQGYIICDRWTIRCHNRICFRFYTLLSYPSLKFILEHICPFHESPSIVKSCHYNFEKNNYRLLEVNWDNHIQENYFIWQNLLIIRDLQRKT